MKQISIAVFSESEENKVKALRVLGMPRIAARIVVYLDAVEGHSATPRQIEAGADMRQPEVSNGLRVLRNNGYVIGNCLCVPLASIAKDLYESEQEKRVAALKACGEKR